MNEETILALKRMDISYLINAIKDGKNINEMYIKNITDILLVAIHKQHVTLFNILLEKFKIKNENNILYLQHAIRTKNIYFVNAIIEKYNKELKNKNEVNIDNYNCLHVAMENYNEKIVELLIENKLDLSHINNYGQTPIHLYLLKENIVSPYIISLLKKNKKILNIKDKNNVNLIDIINNKKKSTKWRNSNIELLEFIKNEK